MENNLKNKTVEYSRMLVESFISSDGKISKDEMDDLHSLKMLIEKFERIDGALEELKSIKEVWLEFL